MTTRKERWLYGHAAHAATASKGSTQVGAALVGPDGEVRLTAYNGPARGVRDDVPARKERPEKYLWDAHAEENLINFAAREGIRTRGCTVYVTHMPCARCTRSMIQAGVGVVVYGPGTTQMPPAEFAAARTMAQEAGLFCRPVAIG